MSSTTRLAALYADPANDYKATHAATKWSRSTF